MKIIIKICTSFQAIVLYPICLIQGFFGHNLSPNPKGFISDLRSGGSHKMIRKKYSVALD